MKRIWKDYFTFSKKERMAVILLLLLITSFIAMPYFYSVKPGPPILGKALSDFVTNSKIMAQLQDSSTESRESFITQPNKKVAVSFSLFLFDPNTIIETEWKRLGVSDKTIHTIINYRNKGGHFRAPEDIRKIWGLRKEEADRIIPYIRISEAELHPFKIEKKHTIINTGSLPAGQAGPKPAYRTGNIPVTIDINTATIEDWKSLPGIGEVLANRIVKYRERMGGFTSEWQVKKTYGISDSVFQLIAPYLKTNLITVQKINLNTVSAYDLRMRADIPDAVAKGIIVYRQQNGPFQSVNDLKKIVFITDSVFQKLIMRVKVE